MSGPCTPYRIRNRPCVACGASQTIRWEYAGQVYCHDGIACGRRMQRGLLAVAINAAQDAVQPAPDGLTRAYAIRHRDTLMETR